MESYVIGWMIAFLVICALEAASLQLVAIWFAAGSLVCVFLSLAGVSFTGQLIAFIVVSLVTMALLRPYAMKKIKPNLIKTNVDDVIGKKAIVLHDFNELTKEGRVQLDGVDWAAKNIGHQPLKKDDEVYVHEIKGVTVLVNKEKK